MNLNRREERLLVEEKSEGTEGRQKRKWNFQISVGSARHTVHTEWEKEGKAEARRTGQMQGQKTVSMQNEGNERCESSWHWRSPMLCELGNSWMLQYLPSWLPVTTRTEIFLTCETNILAEEIIVSFMAVAVDLLPPWANKVGLLTLHQQNFLFFRSGVTTHLRVNLDSKTELWSEDPCSNRSWGPARQPSG